PRRIPRVRGAFRTSRDLRRCRTARRGQRMWNPDHVGHGVGDFVVQALSRQGCIENKKHRPQRRSGGRERMKSGSQTVIRLALLAGISTAGILTASLAHAEDTAHTCDVPAYLLTSESSLPKVAGVAQKREATETPRG